MTPPIQTPWASTPTFFSPFPFLKHLSKKLDWRWFPKTRGEALRAVPVMTNHPPHTQGAPRKLSKVANSKLLETKGQAV